MLKNITQFKSVIGDVENIFHFDSNCPIEVAKVSILECLKWVGQVEDQIKAAQQQSQQQPEQPKEETNDQPPAGSEVSV